MIRCLKIGETWEYQSKLDKGKGEDKTVFVLGALSAEEMAVVMDETTVYRIDPTQPKVTAEYRVNASQRNLLVVRYALKGFKGLTGPDGKEVAFVSEEVGGKPLVTMEILNMIPVAVLTEIAGEALAGNVLNAEEVKD